MLLGQFHHNCLLLIMAALLSVCTKEKQHSVIRFLWLEGVSEPRHIRDFTFSTIQELFCRNRVSRNGLKNSETVAQVLHMRKKSDACAQPQMRTTLNIYVTQFC
jgi:hypothetical protein